MDEVFKNELSSHRIEVGRNHNLGGKTVVPPALIPNVGAFAIFSDPDGNHIGLFKEGHQAE